MATDVKLLKAALEDAKFDDPLVREKIYNCLNSLSDDLLELNFGASLSTDQLFDDLEEYLDTEEEEVEEVDDADEDDDDDDDEEDEDEDEEEDDEITFDVDEEDTKE